jgi:serine/threonine-protein kinase
VILQPGQEFAGFAIGQLLGAGGMGEVYEARHLRLGRIDVLKVLRADVTDPEMASRFLREAQYAARLQHPHVVAIYGAGEVNALLYLHLQRIAGPNLRQLIDRDGPLPPHRAVVLLGGVADALDAAHAVGLIHRDVKPANILVNPPVDGRPEQAYLTDFGISMLLGQTSLTRSGMLVGTLGYLPPELLLGRHPDPRVDVYSLGRVLEESLTGLRPGEPGPAPTHTVVQAAGTRLAPGLQEVIDRACAAEPADRFATCRELINAAWAAFAAPSTVRYMPAPAVPGNPPVQAPQQRRRRRHWRLWLAAAVAVVAAIAVVATIALSGGTKTYLDQLSATQVTNGVTPQLGLVHLGGTAYPHGISFRQLSGEVGVSYAVPKGAQSLEVRPGWDDDQGGQTGTASARFGVDVDGRLIAEETQVRGSPVPAPITVSVGGHASVTLTISVTDGYGVADWADPYFS